MQPIEFHWKLINAMFRLKEVTEQMIQPFCSEKGITPLHLRILVTLHFSGPQTITSLAKQTCMAGANGSALCKRLAGQGLLLRQRDAIDERQVIASLSKEGEALVNEFSMSCTDGYKDMVQLLTKEDAEIILAGIDRLLAVLDKKANNEENKK